MANFSPWEVQAVEVYASLTSVVAGDSIGFHLSVEEPTDEPVSIEIYRSSQLDIDGSQFGIRADRIYSGDYRDRISVRHGQQPVFQAFVRGERHPTPSRASRDGCGWPEAVAWDVPAELRSGVHLARCSHADAVTYALFVVRAARPAVYSAILGQLSVNTYQAYNPWGGLCYYGFPISRPGDPPAVSTVSFERPCQLWDYILYDGPIVAWLDDHHAIDWCTNVDLDGDDTLLEGYQLFVSMGHDEYWSPVMRDRMEAFTSGGGNAMFLTGNTCFRPVEFDGHQMTKTAESWATIGRPEALMTGLNFSAGCWSEPLPLRGFTVRAASHWMLEGTALGDGMVLGEDEGVIGYEADATVLDDDANPADPSPANFVTVAEADLPDWVDTPGRASLGLFWRDGNGVVMAAGTTGWGQGLLVQGSNVERVMGNVVDRLRQRVGALYALTPEGDLWWYRDRTLDDGGDVANPSIVGHGGWNGFPTVFSGGQGDIYAVAQDGNLLWYRHHERDGSGDVANPGVIGFGGWNEHRAVFAGGEGVIYAVTSGGDLVWHRDETRDGTGQVSAPQVIGHGGWEGVLWVFGGGDGIIYAVTEEGDLVWQRDENRDGTGEVTVPLTIGRGGWNVFQTVFSDRSGVIYAVTRDGDLLAYKDGTRDGLTDVADPRIIGVGGWQQFLRVFSGG